METAELMKLIPRCVRKVAVKPGFDAGCHRQNSANRDSF